MYDQKLINIAIKTAIAAGKTIIKWYQSDLLNIDLKEDNSPVSQADIESHNIITESLKITQIPILSEEGENLSYEERKQWEHLWLVDPLDGTKEFIKGNGEFTVNIALIKNKIPVIGIIYIPVLQELFVSTLSDGAYKITRPSANISFTEIKTKGYKLPLQNNKNGIRVLASRSHQNTETENFIKKLQDKKKQIEIIQSGSSVKFCRLAEGSADIYPRFSPTMEWDTAAGHAILKACNKNIYTTDLSSELKYNKPNLTNPSFIAK